MEPTTGGLQTQLVLVRLTRERDCIIVLDQNAQHQLPNTNSILLMLYKDHVMQRVSRDRAAGMGSTPRRGSNLQAKLTLCI